MIDQIMLFLNRCECGISRFGFCHYCGNNTIVNVVIFGCVFGWIIFSLYTLFKD